MLKTSLLTDHLAFRDDTTRRSPDPLVDQVSALADLGCGAASAVAGVIGWHGPYGPALARSPKDRRVEMLEAAGMRLLARTSQAAEDHGARIFRLKVRELGARPGGTALAHDPALTVVAAREDSHSVVAILLTGPERSIAELEPVLRLLANAAIAAITGQTAIRAREFWRMRTAELETALAEASNRGARLEAQRQLEDAAVRESARLKPRDVPAGIAGLVARTGPFEGWMVALCNDGALTLEACSTPWLSSELHPPRDSNCALFDSFKRNVTISRLAAAPGSPCWEDRLFAAGGFSSYLCLPFENGAIALGARGPVEPCVIQRAEAMVARIAPRLVVWALRRQVQLERALAHGLALSLYEAVDAERARIARDLHDDHAQLIAAAQLALAAPRDKARRLLVEIGDGLRRRLRELRPATLGRSTLKSALEREVHRLLDAAVDARLVIVSTRQVPRELQNLCYQVAREAVSNIIRHARAHAAELRLARTRDGLSLSITDDGRGIAPGAHKLNNGAGVGLRGLAERVKMLGGRLKIESRPGRTVVSAEIPMPGLGARSETRTSAR